ncbi:MAG: hypothetical protein DHS20C21_20030 [Gemmatimonadota bacterium]|nr:MAG: hypothetical protein DHS20C21_20030 [Gemmatimonadota bacterium]
MGCSVRAAIGAPGRWAALVWASLMIALPAMGQTWTSLEPLDLSRFSLESIEFQGDFPQSEQELRSAIRSSSSGFSRLLPVNMNRLDADVPRLRKYFSSLGYWNARVNLRREFDEERRRARAVFEIQVGRKRVVGRISVTGAQVLAEEEILASVEQRLGDPFDYLATDRDRRRIESRYANDGFYDVQVIADIRPTSDPDADPRVHDIVYRIDEGSRMFVGAIAVEGNTLTQDRIILRELTFRSGEVLSRDLVDESRARLYASGYFSRVEILPDPNGVRAERVDVIIRVQERTMRFVGLGVGYGQQPDRQQIRLSGEWGHRNLWGRGKRATLRGILATEISNAPETRVEARLVEPWLFNTRTVGSVELSYDKGEETITVTQGEDTGDPVITSLEYDLRLVSLVLNLNRQLTRHTRGFLAAQNEWADLDANPDVEAAIPDDSRPDITRIVSFSLERDRRNNYFDPSRGFLNRVTASVAGGILGGDNEFWKVQVESHWFRTAKGLTLAGRLRVGYEQPFGRTEVVPDRQRFKLGGPNSVRGYDYQSIGPGDFLILSNFETRVPLFWIVSGVVFIDAGNAWEDVDDVQWKDFRITETDDDLLRSTEKDVRYATGVGLRFTTPVGPIRFDVARKLKILPGEDRSKRWGYELSLGHVF